MLDASSVFYMDKLVTGPAGVGVVDIRLPVQENIRLLAKALGKPVEEMVVSVLNRPRHEQLIADIRSTGAGTRLMSDGDVAGGINAARHDARTDMCVGVGGSPEGIVTACAIKALGGHIQGRMWPRDDDERQRGTDAGLPMDEVLEADDLVKGNNTIFVATGVTDGALVAGVKRQDGYLYTESVVLRGHSGTLRRISSDHLESKWL
jgi:fructose-1,6-bisphosphatase II